MEKFQPLNYEIYIKESKIKQFSLIIISSLSEETFGNLTYGKKVSLNCSHLVYTSIVECTVAFAGAVSAELAGLNSSGSKK